jgi:predicted metal-dependent hydrolase
MGNVITPKSFFIKERQMYSNWQFSFWRELFQNSTDAGAKNIRVTITDKGNNVLGIDFDDDGSGMTRQVLEEVYFKLGESTKTGGNTVGGYGRARVLTCFSMKNYTIHTLNSLVQGDGGYYEIADVDYRPGCLLQIEMENESFNTIMDSLKRYLSLTQLSCNVYINGERWTSWCYRYRATRYLEIDGKPFATVYVNKSAANNLLLIRVNGTVMYYMNSRCRAQIVVEINQENSRQVLTANRDGMHSPYQECVYSFIQELASETMSALKSRFGRKSATIRGRGLIYSKSANHKALPKAAQSSPSAAPSQLVQFAEVVSKGGQSVETAKMETFAGTKEFVISVEKGLKVGENYINDLPDIYIEDDTDEPKIRRVIDQYNPANWVLAETNGKTYKKGNNLYKLLMIWKIACEHAVEKMLEIHPEIQGEAWTIGWVFSDAVALHKRLNPGHAFLLNPVDSEGKLKYSLHSKSDLKRIVASAKHEVSHVLHSCHDESFAQLLTFIDSLYDEKEVFRRMSESLKEK